MSKYIDLTGQVFGALRAEKFIGGNYGEWECTCLLCNNTYVTRGKYLRNGYKIMCIDCQKAGKKVDNTSIIKRKYDSIKYNMQGMHIGSIDVIKYNENGSWECKCKCGKTINVKGYNLRKAIENNNDYMCNECKALLKLDDLTGKQFGNWYVKRYIGNSMYECECLCEKHTVKAVSAKSLKSGASKSCGCLTGKLLMQSRYDKYGDIAVNTKQKRTYEQILASSNANQLKAFILSNFSKYPTIKELADSIGVSTCIIARKIHKFNLESYIDYSTNSSNAEKEIVEYIKTLYKGDIQLHIRNILDNNKEIDIYLPDKNTAIEFNGTYWHSTIYKDKNYHQQKTLECINKGIRLVHIFEYEWTDENKKNKIKNYLKNIISDDKIVIYARNTEIVDIINNDVAKKFIDDNHLQNYVYSDINIGLKYNNEIVSIISFGTPRFNKEYQYELLRLATKNNVNIVGGTQKMFKYFINKYNPSSIISYCDLTKFTGGIYKELGFTLNKITNPNYVYVKDDVVISRYQAQKHKLIEYNLGTKEQTEEEIMENLGFLKIYDSGNYKFTLRGN